MIMMKDEQIVKALELCLSGGFKKCEECPLKNQKDGVFNCIKSKQIYALALINRQKAEIERLQNSIKEADNYFSEGEMGKGLAAIINLVKEMTDNPSDSSSQLLTPSVRQADSSLKDGADGRVVKGKWLINPDGYYPYCSECKTEVKIMTKFCPECGAKMSKL